MTLKNKKIALGPTERVQKIISEAGLGSRRQAEEWIRDELVTINGKIAKLGDKATAGVDHIKVKGKLLTKFQKKLSLIFYKPRNVLSVPQVIDMEAKVRPKLYPSAYDYFDGIKERVIPVGKLDKDAEGLLLFTNEKELAARLNSKTYSIPKIYMVKVDGVLDEKQMKRLRNGFKIEDVRVKPLAVEEISKSQGKTWYRVTLVEVPNRLIRKIFENVGHPVDKVRRDSFGPLTLKGLERGDVRILKEEEVESIRKLVGLS